MDIGICSISFDSYNLSRFCLLVQFLKLSLFLVIIDCGNCSRNKDSYHDCRTFNPSSTSVVRGGGPYFNGDGDDTSNYQDPESKILKCIKK